MLKHVYSTLAVVLLTWSPVYAGTNSVFERFYGQISTGYEQMLIGGVHAYKEANYMASARQTVPESRAKQRW